MIGALLKTPFGGMRVKYEGQSSSMSELFNSIETNYICVKQVDNDNSHIWMNFFLLQLKHFKT